MDMPTSDAFLPITWSPIAPNATKAYTSLWPSHLALVCSSASLFGSLMIILTYLAFHDIRSTSREILAYLSLANVGTSACIIWGVSARYPHSDYVGCQAQAVLLIATGIAEFLWNIGLALYLYIIIAKDQSRIGSAGCPKIFYFGCWLPGIIVALVTYLRHHTGVDQGAINTAEWCIIRGPVDTSKSATQNYVIWSMLVGDGWNIAAIFSTICLYLLTKWHIYRETHFQQSNLFTRGALNAAAQIDRKLTFIPLTYFLLHIWSFIRTCMALTRASINSEIQTPWYNVLLGLQTFGDCSGGFANAVIFLLFSPKLRTRIKSAILAKCYFCWYCTRTKCCCCGRGPDPVDDEALKRAAHGNYAQGSVNDQSHVLEPRPLSRYHWGSPGRTSPAAPQNSASASNQQERTPLLPSSDQGYI